MRFEIVGKNVEITDSMRDQIEKKLSNMDKYLLIDPDTIARVVARVYPNSQKIEVTIPTKIGLLRTEVVNDDFYAAVDLAIDKLEDQIRRQKTRLSRRHREHLAQAFIEEAVKDEGRDIPVRTKSVAAEEMALDDAIMHMELLSHNFFIYKDEENGQICVVYRRANGGYGLIEVDED